MQFDYTIKTPMVDLGQLYQRGMSARMAREEFEERKKDRATARTIQAEDREQMKALREAEVVEKQMISDLRKAKYYLENNMIAEAQELGITRLQSLQNKGRPTGETEMLFRKAMSGDIQGALNDINAGLASFGALEKKGKKGPQVGRFKTNKVGNMLVTTDSATGKVVNEIGIPESKKERAEIRKAVALANKAESEAQVKAALATTEEGKVQNSGALAQEALQVTEKLLNHPNLDDITGTINPMLPTILPESQDAINEALRLESLLTVDNLKLMSGVLTDRDIKFLTRVGSGLNITDGGIKGSQDAVKDRLREIAEKLRSGIQPVNTMPQSTSGFSARVID